MRFDPNIAKIAHRHAFIHQTDADLVGNSTGNAYQADIAGKGTQPRFEAREFRWQNEIFIDIEIYDPFHLWMIEHRVIQLCYLAKFQQWIIDRPIGKIPSKYFDIDLRRQALVKVANQIFLIYTVVVIDSEMVDTKMIVIPDPIDDPIDGIVFLQRRQKKPTLVSRSHAWGHDDAIEVAEAEGNFRFG